MNLEEAKEQFQPNLDEIVEDIKELPDIRQIVVAPERTYCDVYAVFDERQQTSRRYIWDKINLRKKTIIDRENKPDLDIWIKPRFDEPLATVDWYDEEVYRA